MKRFFGSVLFVLTFAAVGCNKPRTAEPDLKTGGNGTQPGAQPKQAENMPSAGGGAPSAGGGGNSVNVTPMGGVGAGPMTPVSGTENLQGGGSGAGTVLKQKARGVAGQSPSSVNQMGGDDN